MGSGSTSLSEVLVTEHWNPTSKFTPSNSDTSFQTNDMHASFMKNNPPQPPVRSRLALWDITIG
uniref:Uncharacterized protein n=1 Tax=Anguilla anguilla TaxID=7936 RepID=A0A0E9P708_ANGAN